MNLNCKHARLQYSQVLFSIRLLEKFLIPVKQSTSEGPDHGLPTFRLDNKLDPPPDTNLC